MLLNINIFLYIVAHFHGSLIMKKMNELAKELSAVKLIRNGFDSVVFR